MFQSKFHTLWCIWLTINLSIRLNRIKKIWAMVIQTLHSPNTHKSKENRSSTQIIAVKTWYESAACNLGISEIQNLSHKCSLNTQFVCLAFFFFAFMRIVCVIMTTNTKKSAIQWKIFLTHLHFVYFILKSQQQTPHNTEW